MTVSWYFAYGSNMNPARMAARGMQYVESTSAVLTDWRLCFNKRAEGREGIAFANIVEARGERVEGVLYRLVRQAEIRRMDPYEGYPRRYRRIPMEVWSGHGHHRAWVYVANESWQEDGLVPERVYLNHLLAGRPWLSEDYFRQLLRVPCR